MKSEAVCEEKERYDEIPKLVYDMKKGEKHETSSPLFKLNFKP
jgi:hypothetical protein